MQVRATQLQDATSEQLEAMRARAREQSIESIAMEVERIAEGQRFTTRILAERHPESAPRSQGTLLDEPDTITPR